MHEIDGILIEFSIRHAITELLKGFVFHGGNFLILLSNQKLKNKKSRKHHD